MKRSLNIPERGLYSKPMLSYINNLERTFKMLSSTWNNWNLFIHGFIHSWPKFLWSHFSLFKKWIFWHWFFINIIISATNFRKEKIGLECFDLLLLVNIFLPIVQFCNIIRISDSFGASKNRNLNYVSRVYKLTAALWVFWKCPLWLIY